MSEGRITLVVEDPNWRRSRGLPKKLLAAAEAALKAGASTQATKKKRLPRAARFTILLADNARLRGLNQAFRGKDKPTNVLSFPAAANKEGYVGDIALAYGVARDEAKAAGKSFADHASHLAVHGVLHLAGFDHEKPRDAAKMEGLEVKILSRLGIADPYRSIGQEFDSDSVSNSEAVFRQARTRRISVRRVRAGAVRPSKTVRHG